MRIRMKTQYAGARGTCAPGGEINLPEAESQDLIDGGYAEAVSAPVVVAEQSPLTARFSEKTNAELHSLIEAAGLEAGGSKATKDVLVGIIIENISAVEAAMDADQDPQEDDDKDDAPTGTVPVETSTDKGGETATTGEPKPRARRRSRSKSNKEG